MGVNNQEQDFADRHYKYFGGRQHFSFLTKMAQKHGVSKLDIIISEMKHEGGALKIPIEARIRWFTKVLNANRPAGEPRRAVAK